MRGEGAYRDGVATRCLGATTEIERAVDRVCRAGRRRRSPWKQFRALGSAALALCDVAAGQLDGYLDGHPDQHAPWDYLGGCSCVTKPARVVVDADGRELVDRSTRPRAANWSRRARRELLERLHEGTRR